MHAIHHQTLSPEPQSRRSRPRHRISLFAALVATVASLTVGLARPAEARRLRLSGSDFGISISPDSIRADAGATASFPVAVRAARGVVRPVFDVNGLPSYVDAEIESLGSSNYVLHLSIPLKAPSTNSTYELTARSGTRVRRAYFRLQVVGRATPPVVTLPPVTVPPTAPPTVPPTVPVTVPVVPVTVPPNFNVSVETAERSASTEETAQYKINVDRLNGFNGPVQFTLVNSPQGLVAGYLPNPSTGGTVLYLTPKAGLAAGRYVMTVVASAGSVQKATLIALTVQVTGEFVLLASPQSITRSTPGNAVYRIDVGTNLSSPPLVNYSVDGLPAGATAKLSATSLAGTPVTLTVTTTSAAQPGTYNIVVTGKSGNVMKQVPVQLVVAANATFTTSADTTVIAVSRGGTKTVQLTIKPTGGFTGTITTSVTGLPTGVTYTVGSTSATVNQSFVVPIVFSAAVTAPVTAAAVTVNIVSTSPATSSTGAITSTTPITLNVI